MHKEQGTLLKEVPELPDNIFTLTLSSSIITSEVKVPEKPPEEKPLTETNAKSIFVNKLLVSIVTQ